MDALARQGGGSVLWLLRANAWADANLLREAKSRGVDPARVIFANPMPHELHLARPKQADLVLDTFNVDAHTTATDALWGGVASRHAAGAAVRRTGGLQLADGARRAGTGGAM
ncbi:hypothetical protein [Rhizorhabdus dicambivorans]|uniref:O-linked N-acetylglucosamine transferase family protein n=1 Tax=Rhizorhabdus dicambivorans TaxID=1850238 RepID=UPI001596CC91|nr:hypothetical protein [Rhizorhabdus dicambivorans]